jgi:hypothetical protein
LNTHWFLSVLKTCPIGQSMTAAIPSAQNIHFSQTVSFVVMFLYG